MAWQGLFAPAKTPAAIIQRLNVETVKLMNKPDVKELLLNSGAEVVGSSSDEAESLMKSEIARMGKVIKEAGIKAD